MRSASTFTLLALAALVMGLAGCGGRAAVSSSRASWYQLRKDAFATATSPDAGPAEALKPWTVQSRVADMAFLDGTLYCALNGSGLASIALDAHGAPTFIYHADNLIFSHRTITALVPRQGTLTVHLYYNALLNDVPRTDLTLNGISLVAFLPQQEDYSFLIPPFQRQNPDWEAVGFATESENSFDFQWKFTDAAQTRFSYSRFHADTRTEEPVTREVYQAALGVSQISGSSVPSDLATFFGSCKTQLALPNETSLQFVLRSRESPVRRNYRSKVESDSAVQIPVFEEGTDRYALLPGGHLLEGGAQSAVHVVDLPALPAGFRYTDVVKVGPSLLIPWEESSFTDVGRAGLLVYSITD